MSWLVSFPVGADAAPRLLYCLPHAGAGASIYRAWAEALAPGFQVVGVQPPGREHRRAEPVPADVAALGAGVAAAIAAHADRPFALFGHSLGALVAFEAARALETMGQPPRRLVVSGSRAPQLPREGLPPADDEAVLARLRALGGTPAEVLASPELLALFLPVLRADLALAATYRMAPGRRLATPVAAMGGLADAEVPRRDLMAWQAQTEAAFEAALFPGGHFYLHDDRPAALAAVARLAGE